MTKSSSLTSSSSTSSTNSSMEKIDMDYVADPDMKTEIEAAVGFLTDFLVKSSKTEFSSESVDLFRRCLESILYRRFNGHWYLSNPLKGSGFRCLRINGKLDPVVAVAAEASRLPLRQVRQAFPAELTVWVDPGDVSVRFGDEGSIGVWYAAQRTDEEQQQHQQTRPLKTRSLEENYQQQHHAGYHHQMYQRTSPPLSSTPPTANAIMYAHHPHGHQAGFHRVQYHPASPINAQFQQRQQSSPVWNPHWQPQAASQQQANRRSSPVHIPATFTGSPSNNGFMLALNHQQQQMQMRQTTPIRYVQSPSNRISPQPIDATMENGEDQRCKLIAERLMRDNMMPTFTPNLMSSRPQPVGVGVN